jgi:hypothetical protein
MNHLKEDERRLLYGSWSQMVVSLLGCQWKLLAGQYQAGLALMEEALRTAASTQTTSNARHEVAAPIAEECLRLQREAIERIGQGLAPPKRIYAIPYRDRIDWSRFPVWARPSDPELFEGCAHEG